MGCGGSKPVAAMDPNVNNTHFDIERVVGEGGFGKVNAAIKKNDQKWYAIKKLTKAVVVKNNSADMLMNERNLLALVTDPFIINMHYAYQDPDNCYLVMDLCLGGDLRYHLKKLGVYNFDQTRFFMACAIRGVSYLHSKRILHRDIKPDNAVMDEKGYVRMTDLGISVLCEGDGDITTQKRSGTKPYMPPEVFAKPHTQGPAADYWMLGIMMHEFLYGKRPWKDISDMAHYTVDTVIAPPESDTFLKLNSDKVQLDEATIDFIRRLLEIRPWMRLGFNGVDEVKAHPYWNGFDWEALENKTMVPPFIPDTTKANCDTGSKDLQDMFDEEGPKKKAGPSLTPEQQAMFDGYNYNDEPVKEAEGGVEAGNQS